MSCVYIIYDKDGKTSKEITYQELVKLYRDGNYRDISDILYSKGSKQDAIFSQILKDKHDFKVVLNEDKNSGEPDYSDGKLTTQTFIDSGQFTVRGERPILQENDEQYIEHVTQTYIEEGLSPEEAKNKANLTVQNWKTINEDAKELHRLLNSFNFREDNLYGFIELLEGTRFENSASDIYEQIKETNGLRHIMFSSHKLASDTTTKIIQSVNLLAKVNGSGDDIIGHIDNLVIDTDGNLHIYNYKITSNPVSEMTKGVKFEKYKYQMALLKQILAYNGYNVTNTTLHIIPIRLTYNDDFSKINSTSIYASNHIQLSQGAAFNKYETIAKHFIKSNVTINPISSTIIGRINKNLEHIFPERAINYTGIQKSVDEWIKYNFSTKLESRIKKVDAPDHVYELYLDDSLEKSINITNPDPPLENEDIRKEVTKYLKNQNTNNSIYLKKIVDNIRVSYRQQKSTLSKDSSNRSTQLVGSFLDKSLSKYIISTHKDGDKDISDWDLISDDTLLDSNILVFKHYKTEQIDVVTLSDYNLRAVLPTSSDRTNIMGYFLRDSNKDTKGLINYKQSFSNIEAIRTMTILNEVLPELTQQNLKFGELRIISTQNGGDMELFNFEQLNRELFQEVIKVVVSNDSDFNYTNNFTKAKYSDPIEDLLYDFQTCIASNILTSSEKQEITDLGFDNLESLSTREQKRIELQAIINRIYNLSPTIQTMKPQEIIQCSRSDGDKQRRALANLYILTQNAYCYYSGIKVAREYKISKAREYGMTQNRINNRTYQGVTNRFIQTIDDIASQVRSEYNHIYNFTIEFYNKQGFGDFRSSAIGDNSKAFENLYRRNSNNEILMEFRNPYEQDSQIPLNNAEKKYLKQVLFEFAKIRSQIYGFDFNFGKYYPVDETKLIEFINKNKSWYFNTPLEKASDATRRSLPMSQRIDNWKDQASRLLHNPKEAFNEFVQKFDTVEEAEMMEEGLDSLALRNKYITGDGYTKGEDSRNQMLKAHPNGYFETNVENLLAHYLEKNIQVRELNKTLIGVKGTLLQLAMIGDAGNDSKNLGVKQTIKMTEDYIKQNVFNISLMEPESQKIMAWVYPFRKAVSTAYIAGNIVSMFRDTFEGMWQNTARMLTKYQTDIDAKSLTKAYKEVTLASFTSMRNITIIDELCKTYRLSNLDIARISEGLTTSRGGLMNIENWMYTTLRAPDFLNRMVLFVAKAMKDGSWEAFDLKDNKLVYNWKKDKRFSIYADNSKKGTEEWNKQRIAYYNAIRQYNNEHPDSTIEYIDDLPVAYSNVEIQQFRQLSNSIYGAYDKSMRAKYENTALGLTFAMFSTWMNGQISNYFTKPGQYADGITVVEQDTDGSGNLLYMDLKGNIIVEIKQGDSIKYIYELSGEEVENPEDLVPIMKNVPRVVQGIIYTFRDAFMCLREGGLAEFKKEILNDPMQMANIKKALSDLLMTLLFYSLFRFGVSPLYKEYKKDMSNHPAVQNGIVEVLYKSSSNSYDGFLGPIAAISYLGSNTNPPMYSLSTKVVGDLAKFTLGDKTFGQLLSGNLAVFRSFGDTYNAELKKLN